MTARIAPLVLHHRHKSTIRIADASALCLLTFPNIVRTGLSSRCSFKTQLFQPDRGVISSRELTVTSVSQKNTRNVFCLWRLQPFRKNEFSGKVIKRAKWRKTPQIHEKPLQVLFLSCISRYLHQRARGI